jgi:Fe-S-cluster-containing dehydrogenase component
MQIRPKDGIVFVRQEMCVGCKTCITACPWGAPQWNPATGKVVKCDYCMDRLDRGQQPACVATCTTRCLEFGPAEKVPQIRRLRTAEAMASLEHSAF